MVVLYALDSFFWYFLFGFYPSRCNKLECRGVNSRQIHLGKLFINNCKYEKGCTGEA